MPSQSPEHFRSIRRLGRDTILYGVAAILSRAVAFIMLPVYTRYLTPADYGLLSILDLSQEIAMILFSAGATAGLMRFYFKTPDPKERNRVLFTGWGTVTLLYLAGTALLLAVAPLIWVHALSRAGTVGLVRLAAMNFLLGSMMIVPMQMLSIDQRPVATSIVLTAKLVVQLSLNILFVVVLRAGPAGILWSTFYASLTFGLIMTTVLLRRTGVSWSWPAFRDLRRFSLPIQISTAGAFFLTYGDRFFLEKSHGLAAVGVYGIAYQFGWLISGMIGAPFFQAWNPQRFQLARESRAHRDASYNRGFLYGNVVIVGGAVAITLFIRPILAIMTTADFHTAAVMVPALVLAYVFQVWATVVDFGIEISEQTRYTSLATWISVALIAVLYVTLIPPLGGLGAAIATLAAMFVRFVTTLYFAQRVWPVSYHWSPHLRMLAGGTLVATAVHLVPVTGTMSLLVLAVGGCCLYALWVWFGVLHIDERAALWRLARSPGSFRDLLTGS